MASSGDATLFAYEGVNPRFGKVVKAVRLHSASGFVNTRSRSTPDNAIVLAGIGVVKKRRSSSEPGNSWRQ